LDPTITDTFLPSSDDLLQQARLLDTEALTLIHDRHYLEVYRYVRFRLGGDVETEDITAEVFLRFLDALRKRRGPDRNLRGWLFGTASHLVSDHYRRSYRQKEQHLDESHENELVDGESPEATWESLALQQEIRRALTRLTSEQQHVLALRFADNYSLEDTAQWVGKKVNAVKALQFRALSSLRRLLVEEKPTRE
jgi:RNA polymerase sigma-70 factor, ECF subfamily